MPSLRYAQCRLLPSEHFHSSEIFSLKTYDPTLQSHVTDVSSAPPMDLMRKMRKTEMGFKRTLSRAAEFATWYYKRHLSATLLSAAFASPMPSLVPGISQGLLATSGLNSQHSNRGW